VQVLHIRAVAWLASEGYVAHRACDLRTARAQPHRRYFGPTRVAIARKFVANPDWAAMLRDTPVAIDAVKNVGPVALSASASGGSCCLCRRDKTVRTVRGRRLLRRASFVLDDKPKVPDTVAFRRLRKRASGEDVETIRRASDPEVEVFVYPGAQHGFHCAERASYDRNQRRHRLPRSIDFFAKHLKESKKVVMRGLDRASIKR